jgi:hypothetical protein
MPKRARSSYKKRNFTKRNKKSNKKPRKTTFKKRVQKVINKSVETKISTYKAAVKAASTAFTEAAFTDAGGTYQIPYNNLIELDENIIYTSQGIEAPVTVSGHRRIIRRFSRYTYFELYQ